MKKPRKHVISPLRASEILMGFTQKEIKETAQAIRETSKRPSIRQFKSGATRDTDDGKLDWEGFISPIAMRRFAEYMHRHRVQADGSLRDSDNWQAGFPRRQTMKSLVRHAWDLWYEWRRGKDEVVMVDLLCAVIFNAQSLLLEITLERDVKE